MADNNTYPKVILKKKQIPTLIDFCLEESIEFSVKQQTFPETDWEVELRLKDFRTAVLVGMYLRENKMELDGIDPQRYKKQSAPSGSSKKSDEKPESSKSEPLSTSPKSDDKIKNESAEPPMPTLL
ncbi:MAG: hypothetical protein N2662_10965 [Bacteroidales bacterium]|nr:hypothetical protein [Bacteroidales bacterium]